MARRGFEEGFANKPQEILPGWRWPLLHRTGPTTGLLDYDLGRFVGSDFGSKVNALKTKFNVKDFSNEDILNKLKGSNIYDLSRSLNVRPRDLVKMYRDLPQDYQSLIRAKSDFSSPVFRHLSDAMNAGLKQTKPTLLEEKILPRLYGEAGKSNMLTKTVGLSGLNAGAQDAVLSTAVTGSPIKGMLQGLAVGMAESAPEAAALSAAASGKTKTLAALKANLINMGYRGTQQPMAKTQAQIMKGLDSNMREFVMAGEDLAKPVKNKMDQMLQKQLLKGVQEHGSPQHIATAAKEELATPVLKKIENWLPLAW